MVRQCTDVAPIPREIPVPEYRHSRGDTSLFAYMDSYFCWPIHTTYVVSVNTSADVSLRCSLLQGCFCPSIFKVRSQYRLVVAVNVLLGQARTTTSNKIMVHFGEFLSGGNHFACPVQIFLLHWGVDTMEHKWGTQMEPFSSLCNTGEWEQYSTEIWQMQYNWWWVTDTQGYFSQK